MDVRYTRNTKSQGPWKRHLTDGYTKSHLIRFAHVTISFSPLPIGSSIHVLNYIATYKTKLVKRPNFAQRFHKDFFVFSSVSIRRGMGGVIRTHSAVGDRSQRCSGTIGGRKTRMSVTHTTIRRGWPRTRLALALILSIIGPWRLCIAFHD